MNWKSKFEELQNEVGKAIADFLKENGDDKTIRYCTKTNQPLFKKNSRWVKISNMDIYDVICLADEYEVDCPIDCDWDTAFNDLQAEMYSRLFDYFNENGDITDNVVYYRDKDVVEFKIKNMWINEYNADTWAVIGLIDNLGVLCPYD